MKLVHHITGISYTFDLHAPLTIVNHSLLDLPPFLFNIPGYGSGQDQLLQLLASLQLERLYICLNKVCTERACMTSQLLYRDHGYEMQAIPLNIQ